MEWLHHVEAFFSSIAQVGQILLEGIAIICVLIGLFATAQLVKTILRQRRSSEFPFVEVRLKFGLWLALALEFQLGADILNTTIAPTTESLIRLAVIAVIRTFLNYFLNKEIESELEMSQKTSESQQGMSFGDRRPQGNPHE